MFYEVNTKDVVDYDPQRELDEMDFFQLPRCFYVSSEWTELTMRRIKLRSLLDEESASYKKELSYNMVYSDMTLEQIFGG